MAVPGSAGVQIRAGDLSVDVRVGGNPADKFGYWAAILTAVACVLFDGAAGLGAAGTAVGKLPLLAALLIAPAFVALVAALDRSAAPLRRVWTTTALAFAAAYAAIIALNYGLQLTVVRWAPEAYPFLTTELTPASGFWALEIIGYGFMTLASLFIIPALATSRPGRAAAWLFTVSAISSGLAVVIYGSTGDPGHVLAVASLIVWGVAFPIAAVLIAAMFSATSA